LEDTNIDLESEIITQLTTSNGSLSILELTPSEPGLEEPLLLETREVMVSESELLQSLDNSVTTITPLDSDGKMDQEETSKTTVKNALMSMVDPTLITDT
jgi:hypothetical protein